MSRGVLSVRELEILLLAARGLSNREIQRVSVSLTRIA
jgi:DNA-binding CsgD family transcriptional regulator